MTQLTNVVFIHAKPGMTAQLGARLADLVDISRQEPGCLNYDLHQSNDDPDLWFVYENWKAPSDLDLHMHMPYMTALLGELDTLVQGDVKLQGFHMVSTAARK